MTRSGDVAPPPVAATPPSPAAAPAAQTPRRVAKAEATPAPAESAAAPATPGPEEEAPNPRSVRVVVVAEADGAPVEGAEVHVDEIDNWEDELVRAIDAKTDAAGVVVVTVGRGPTAFLVVRKRGFLVARQRLDGNVAETRVQLAPGVPVAGRVVLADTRAPVSGVAVRVWDNGKFQESNDDGELDRTVVTGDDGRFEFAGLPPLRQATIVAAKAGFRSQNATVTPATTPGPEIEMLLGDGGVMFGVVFGEDGRPLPGVEVLQMPVDREELPDRPSPGVHEAYAQRAYITFLFPPVLTDAEGRYEFRGVRLPIGGVPQPRVAVARRADGHNARGEPATFTQQGERQQRDVRFAAAPALTVQVKTATPLPADVKVRAQRNGGSPDLSQPLPADGGPVRFAGLTPGLYFVSVSSGEFGGDRWDFTQRVTLAPGDAPTVDFVLGDAARIAGRVVDEKGDGIGGMEVEVNSAAADQQSYVTATALTGKDGSFALEHLLPVPATITAGLSHMRQMEASLPGARGSGPGIETVHLDGVLPGGTPLLITLRRLGKLTGRVAPVPAERNRGFQALAGRVQGYSNAQIADDGSFTCDAPLVGVPMVIWMECEGHAPLVLDVAAVASGETRDLGVLELKAGRTLDGRLVDGKGDPLAATEVRMLERWTGLQAPTTDADGRFHLDRLPDRPVVLRIAGDARTSVTIVVVPANAASPLTIAVGPGALIQGRVLDASGSPVAKANVIFHPGADLTDDEDAFGRVESDASGRFAFRLQAGRGTVVAYRSSSQGKSDEIELTVADGDTRDLELRLR